MTSRENLLFRIFLLLLVVTVTGINIYINGEKKKEINNLHMAWEKSVIAAQESAMNIEKARFEMNNNPVRDVGISAAIMDDVSVGEAYQKSFQRNKLTLTRYAMSGAIDGTMDFFVTGDKDSLITCLADWDISPLPGILIGLNLRIQNSIIESSFKVRYINETE
jgi:hypothetical protein